MSNGTNPVKSKRFGRYLLLDHLVDGGMAKICRARHLGEQANKIVAIKMIQPQYSSDPKFRKMFMDEIKVAFGLIHPNIAQTYDYGMLDGQLYTAMEYCDGANLKQYLERLKVKGYVFPIEISIYIISQVCLGLEYAHNYTDRLTGKKIRIIHRDISPHNIMITHDGAVKIIDFGIAKAETNQDSTKAGTIKGKLSYLAPEYLEGQELDHRYDIFAVGITLWELLCCRKLFHADNELAVLKQIQACKVTPPSSINPNVTKELDAIVLKALAKDRNMRYADMEQFNRALVKYLYSNHPDFNASDLSHFANELFSEEIKKDREKLINFGKIDISEFIQELKNEQEGKPAPAANVQGQPANKEPTLVSSNKTAIESRDNARKEIDFGFSKDTNVKTGVRNPTPNTSIELGNKKSSQPEVQNLKAARPAPNPVAEVRQIKQKTTDYTRNTTKPQYSNIAPPSTAGVSNFVIVLLVGVLGYVGFNQKNKLMNAACVIVDLDHCHEKVPVIDPSSTDRSPNSVAEKASLTLTGYDPVKMEVFIDNKKYDYKFTGNDVPTGKPFTITIRQKGKKDYTTTVTIEPGKKNFNFTVPEMEDISEGLLYTSNNYRPGTSIELVVNGTKVERDLPFSNWRLPAGTYEAKIKNEFFGTEKKVTFEILENKSIILPNE